MASTHIIQQYGESSLYAVPGVHFNDLFAREVNRICADPTTQPAAIAVELGPTMTAAALKWLQELVGEPGKRLPIMLALVRTNRFIRGSLREKTRRLQVEMGKDLSEMSPEVLHRELGFSSHELLCLSPADSIVEALRCGIELDVPVYGVDLDGCAGHLGGSAVIRDPFASPDTGAFVLGNAALADQLRDEEVDSRREMAMAARLKTLLQKHSKVLFTGGLAHWLRIRNLLGDGSLRPAPVGHAQDKVGSCFVRAVIHPALALRCIDPFPGIPVLYEETRVPAHLPSTEKAEVRRRGNLDHVSIFRDSLDRAYRSYFQEETLTRGDEERHLDLQTLPAFEVYLRNLCLLGHRRTPHLFSVLGSAREMMSPSFSQTIAATFMDVPWAKPADLPDCAIILPGAVGEDSVVLIQNDCKKENIYSRFLHGSNGEGATQVPCDWSEHQKPPEFQFVRTYLHSWPPWDHLMTSLSLRAIMLGKQRQKKMRTQVFEDSLLEGIDMKATVRAFSRGEERYYVRDLSRKNESLSNPLDGFPVVWITHCEASTADNWNLYFYLYKGYEPYIRNKEALARVTQKAGPNLMVMITCGRRSSLPPKSSDGVALEVDRYQGLAAFNPVSWTERQIAHWAENTRYRRNPFYQKGLTDSEVLRNLVIQAHPALRRQPMRIPWSTAIILAVLPYAAGTITVVAPHSFVIDRVVLEQARRRNISVRKVPIDSFTRDELNQLASGYMIPGTALNTNGNYPGWVEKTIGQSQSDNLDLVPQWVRDFGHKRSGNGGK